MFVGDTAVRRYLEEGKVTKKEPKTKDLAEIETKIENMHVEEVNMKPEILPKHSLQHAWTLWFFKNDKSLTWEENQRPIITVKSVEDFWRVYNHVQLASKLPPGSDYSLFKEGIFPDWEDKKNAAGGRWIVNVDKQDREQVLDKNWQEILFYMIGEQAGIHAHLVNGGVVSVRARGDKLGVWLADSSPRDSVVKIGTEIKERLGIDPEQTIAFHVHKTNKKNIVA